MFPADLPVLTNPTGADDLDTPAVLHSTQHATLNVLVEAIAAKLGVDASVVATSLDYKVSHLRTDVDGIDGRVDTLEANAVTSIDDLSDVDTTSTPPADGDRLAFDSASGLWLPTAASAGMLSLDDLTDVDLTSTPPADGDALVYDSAAGAWVPGSVAGGGGSGLLAATSYGQVTNYTTSSSTSADIDAANLVLPAFTVPASGQVLVRFEAVMNLSADASNYGLWAVREGAADVVAKRVTAQGVANTVVRSFLITGLTPGASKTYKWGWSALGGLTFTMFTDPSSFGAAVMEAWAA